MYKKSRSDVATCETTKYFNIEGVYIANVDALMVFNYKKRQ